MGGGDHRIHPPFTNKRWCMSVLRHFIHGVDWISEHSGKLVSFLAFPMMACIFYEVIMRYFFNMPTIWAHEMSTFFLGAYFILGGGYTLWRGAHVNVDIFHKRLSLRGKAILDVVTSVFFFAFAGVLTYHGVRFGITAWTQWQHSVTVWGPPLFPIKTALPIGAILLLLAGIVKLIKDISTAVTGKGMVTEFKRAVTDIESSEIEEIKSEMTHGGNP